MLKLLSGVLCCGTAAPSGRWQDGEPADNLVRSDKVGIVVVRHSTNRGNFTMVNSVPAALIYYNERDGPVNWRSR